MFNSNPKIILFTLTTLAILALIVAYLLGVDLNPFKGIMDYLP